MAKHISSEIFIIHTCYRLLNLLRSYYCICVQITSLRSVVRNSTLLEKFCEVAKQLYSAAPEEIVQHVQSDTDEDIQCMLEVMNFYKALLRFHV